LRVEVLRALEVRRPEVRPLLEWFELHKAFSATIICDDDGAIGFLLLPAGGRTDVMTLEEAQAARALADRISALLAVTSAMERARRRQLEAQADAERWQQSFERVDRVLQGAAERHRAAARALARPLLVAAYSPAVRLLLSEMDRATRSAHVVVLVVPTGVNAEAWAARLHLGWQLDGPLFCVDGGEARTEQFWSEPARSPVALCERGTLFIRDVDLLSPRAQELLVSELTTRWEAPPQPAEPPRLVLAFKRRPEELVREGSIGVLQSWVNKDVFELPTLLDRPEDLRALVIDIASRNTRGPERQPLGVERGALQALLDYAWPGNDAQLRDVLERAAAIATGPLITLSDLSAVAFPGVAATPPLASPSAERSESVTADARPDYRPRSRAPRSRRRRGR
jgi:transcriptional regulator of acetoin/glycerol metabolism